VYAAFVPADALGAWVYASLFASHSVGIVFPVIRELNVVRTRFGVAVLASTVITDLLSLVLLAIVIQLKRHGSGGEVLGSISVFDKVDPALFGNAFIPLFIIVIALYLMVSVWGLPFLLRRLLAHLEPNDDSRVTFFLMGLLIVVFIGELIGVSIIVGAFIAGIAFVRVPTFHDRGRILHKKIEGIGYGFLIPFLFLSIGMKSDLSVLTEAPENLMIMLLTVVGLVGSKVFSGWAGLRLAGFSHKKSVCAGLMTVPQLSATLAAAAVALELDLLSPVFFNAIVVLSIVTTIPVPVLVRLMIVKGKIQFDSVEDHLAPGLTEQEQDEPEEDLI
jgi:Kef-type K+ transport system membrane component KefB